MDSIIPNPSLFTIQAVVFLDSDGRRIYSKFYGKKMQTLKQQKSFETKLFSATPKENYEIFMLDNFCVIYRIISDVFLYVLGNANENQVCLCFNSAFSQQRMFNDF
ncbi:hypothetical protein MXB_4146 [Myxobolus squamalis]|nr:hypothetical protein MXB_4146 [Myxobolus squamalis]